VALLPLGEILSSLHSRRCPPTLNCSQPRAITSFKACKKSTGSLSRWLGAQAPPPDPAWMPELTDNDNLSLQKINGLLYSIVAAGGPGVLVGPLSLLPVICLLNRNYRQRGDL
jgi:hypothetical protein